MYKKCYLSYSDETLILVVTFLAYKVGKCDNKVNTSVVVTFLLPTEEKNVTTSQNAEMADLEIYDGFGDFFCSTSELSFTNPLPIPLL